MLLEVFDVLQNTMLKNLVYKYLSTSCIIFRLDSQNWKYWVEDMKCDEHSDNELVHILKYFCAEILWSKITFQRICSFYFMYVCFFKRVGFPVIFPVCKKKNAHYKKYSDMEKLKKESKNHLSFRNSCWRFGFCVCIYRHVCANERGHAHLHLVTKMKSPLYKLCCILIF